MSAIAQRGIAKLESLLLLFSALPSAAAVAEAVMTCPFGRVVVITLAAVWVPENPWDTSEDWIAALSEDCTADVADAIAAVSVKAAEADASELAEAADAAEADEREAAEEDDAATAAIEVGNAVSRSKRGRRQHTVVNDVEEGMRDTHE
jgi:hypothetical protein